MGQGNLLLGYQQGSIGDVVFSRQGGKLVTRARNRNPLNPKTVSQMSNRINFAPFGAFYSRSTENLMKYAFQTKEKYQSDYQRFVQLNTQMGFETWVTKEEMADPTFSLYGKYMMAQGSLPFYKPAPEYDNGTFVHLGIDFGPSPEPGMVASPWAQMLQQNPLLRNGDIVTFVCIVGGTLWDPALLAYKSEEIIPQYTIRQFQIGACPDNEVDVANYLSVCGLEWNNAIEISQGITRMGVGFRPVDPYNDAIDCLADTDQSYFGVGYATIVSRKGLRGMITSNSQMQLSKAAEQTWDYMLSDGARTRALESYQTAPVAILEGSLLPIE